MYKLEIKLKQHTPMIHFQSDQEGATLRATEVKPKLDRFILKRLGGTRDRELIEKGKQQWERICKERRNDVDPIDRSTFDQLPDYNKGCLIAKVSNWLIGKGEHMALDYKMKITCTGKVDVFDINGIKDNGRPMPYPLFFGNMNKDRDDETEYKRYCWTDAVIDFTIHSFKSDFIDWLKSTPDVLSNFFLQTNFGTRQSKGFGSFWVDQEIKQETNPLREWPHLVLRKMQGDRKDGCWRKLFNDLDLFYKFLRGGINQNGFYTKPFIFDYMKDYMGCNWEKRFVKKTYFNKPCFYKDKWEDKEMPSLEEQKERHKEPDSPINFENNGYRIIRDLFGLSTTASWRDYGAAQIEKIDVKGEIVRFPSPFMFKILEVKKEALDVYYVGIVFNLDVIESFEKNLRGREFSIRCNVGNEVCKSMNTMGLNVVHEDKRNILSGKNISFPQELHKDQPDISFLDFWVDFFQQLENRRERIMESFKWQNNGLGAELKTILGSYQYKHK